MRTGPCGAPKRDLLNKEQLAILLVSIHHCRDQGPGSGENPVALHLLPSCTGRHRPVCLSAPWDVVPRTLSPFFLGGAPCLQNTDTNASTPLQPWAPLSLYIRDCGPHPFQLPIFPWPGQEDSVPMSLVPMVASPHTPVLDLTKGFPNMPLSGYLHTAGSIQGPRCLPVP